MSLVHNHLERIYSVNTVLSSSEAEIIVSTFVVALVIQGYEIQANYHRPSRPTPTYGRPKYSVLTIPLGSHCITNRLTIFIHKIMEMNSSNTLSPHPMTSRTSYDAFEGDTGNAQYLLLLESH